MLSSYTFSFLVKSYEVRHELLQFCSGAQSATAATRHMAASPREDPSRLTKEELSTRGAETVAAVGAIARLVAKQSVSAPLQSTISTFADYEKTVVSTEEMLRKTMKGMSDMSDALDEISSSMQGPSSTNLQVEY